jgi:oxaloacetate decarboxylase alpha subunit
VAEIEFVDQTMRDGQQSLWGLRMRSGHITAVADQIDRAGYRTVEIIAGAPERLIREDKWERVDWHKKCLPNSKLRCARVAKMAGGMGIAPHCIQDLTIQTFARHGIDSFWVLDCLYDMPALKRVHQVVADTGCEIAATIMFGIAPVLTDEWFADKVHQFISWGLADTVYVEDASGILTPQRTATLMRAIVDAAGEIPVEIHCHNTTGLAPANYVEAINQGARIVHTASRPLANGPSLPSTEMTAETLELLGHSHHLDLGTLPPVAAHFERVARQEGFPVGAPVEHNVGPYLHHLPGGMTGTLKAQLADHDMSDRYTEVLREVARVRGELGHPISATPFSQFLGIQAVLNVTTGDRYSIVPDEVIQYVLGHFGDPPAPFDQNVKDRILACPAAKKFADWQPPNPSLTEIKQQYGYPGITDEELLTRYYVTPEDIAATRATPLKTNYEFLDDIDVARLTRAVMPRKRVGHFHAAIDDIEVTFNRADPDAGTPA